LAELKRIMITLPVNLLTEIDGLARSLRGNRSQILREAAQHYVEHLKRERLRQQMIVGYQEMAQLNLILAEEGFSGGYSQELASAGGDDQTEEKTLGSSAW